MKMQLNLFDTLEADKYWQALQKYKGDIRPYRTTLQGGGVVSEILQVGDIVTTNYNTGPYLIEKITLVTFTGCPPCYSLRMYRLSGQKSFCYINELVAVGGRLLKLFKANLDEVFLYETK